MICAHQRILFIWRFTGGGLRQGATERSAKEHAVMGLDDYKKGKFKKVSALIEDRIKRAKRDAKA